VAREVEVYGDSRLVPGISEGTTISLFAVLLSPYFLILFGHTTDQCYF